MKIKITSDSTCDLTADIINKYNIGVIPLAVNMGENTYLDGVDVKPSDIYEYFEKTGDVPTTGARSPEDFKDFFKKYTDEGYEIVHIGIGGDFSCCFNNIQIAAQDLKGVYPVDSQSLSTGTGLLVMYAAELAKSGKYSAEQIASKVKERVPHVQASFVIEKLKFLHKGGRCSMLAVLGANLLRLKPSIHVKDGKNIVGKKYMGNMIGCIKKYIEDVLAEHSTPDHTRVMITYSTATQEMLDVAKSAVEAYGKFKEIIFTQAGSVINCHCGQNTLGILYINDGDENH
ncbi:MAG: DegV family protein [Clostridia bacterium]|nr:DegV family protein [Clostridia bacterium]